MRSALKLSQNLFPHPSAPCVILSEAPRPRLHKPSPFCVHSRFPSKACTQAHAKTSAATLVDSLVPSPRRPARGRYSRLLWETATGVWGCTICWACLLLLETPVAGTAEPRHRAASSSSPGPGALSILRRRWRGRPHQEASCHQVRSPLQPAGVSPSCAFWGGVGVTPQRRPGLEDGGRGWEKGLTEGKGEKLCLKVPSLSLAPGVPGVLLQLRAGAGDPARSGGLYGTVPSAPREAPGAGEEGPGAPPAPAAARVPIGRAPGDVRGAVGSPRTKEMLRAGQDWGKKLFFFQFPLRSSNF